MAEDNQNSSTIPPEFFALLDSCSHIQKKEMLVAVRKSLEKHNNSNSPVVTDFNQFVEHITDFVPSDFLDEAVMAELSG